MLIFFTNRISIIQSSNIISTFCPSKPGKPLGPFGPLVPGVPARPGAPSIPA